MEIGLYQTLRGKRARQWEALLKETGLHTDEQLQETVLIFDGDTLAATGSRYENVLKCIAVDPAYQGEGLTATVISHLRQSAFAAGFRHLFLYTKPENASQFASLFFYPIAGTESVLLMEDRKNGIEDFLQSLPEAVPGKTAAALVMNCNPFTLGHRYLIETASRNHDAVYVFVLSEPQPPFPAEDRLTLVKQGTADLPNVKILPTGPYLISAATFPTYFLKDRDRAETVHCALDVEIFKKYFVPRFGITHRYVGTEPGSLLTNSYNQVLKASLGDTKLVEIPRLCHGGKPISASTVRSLLDPFDEEALTALVPPTTLSYLRSFTR